MKINHCGICGWYGMSWSWIYAFGTSKNKPLFQCDRPQNKFQGRSILWLLSCGKHRRWSQYISIISHLSHFTIKHPFGSARILPKKENYIRNKKNTSSTPPKSYSLIIIDLLSGHMFNSKVVGCNSLCPIHVWRCSLEVSDFTTPGLNSDSIFPLVTWIAAKSANTGTIFSAIQYWCRMIQDFPACHVWLPEGKSMNVL